MVAITQKTGRAVSSPNGLIKGLISALCIILLGSFITAKLVEMEILNQQNIGYSVMVILLISSWTGATISYKKIKRRKIMICTCSGLCLYGTLLLITAICFGGEYSGAGETGLLILCGSILSIFFESGRKKERKSKKIKVRSC